MALVGFEGQIKLEVDNVAFEFTSLSEKNLILIQINWLSSEEFGFFSKLGIINCVYNFLK